MELAVFLYHQLQDNSLRNIGAPPSLNPETMTVLARKLAYACAKTYPSRWHKNKILKNLFVLRSFTHPTRYNNFWRELIRQAQARRSEKPDRVKVCTSIMFDPDIRDRNAESLLNYVVTNYGQVEQQDSMWFEELTAQYGVNRLSCGHFSSNRVGLATSWINRTTSDVRYVCAGCIPPNHVHLADVSHTVNTDVYGPAENVVDCYYFTTSERVQVLRNNPWIAEYDHRTLGGVVRRWYRTTVYSTRQANLIGSYHSSRSRGFAIAQSPWSKAHHGRVFGVELEVQVTSLSKKNEIAGRLNDILNNGNLGDYCYFENDGSLGESGIEIVTQPRGLDVHATQLGKFLTVPDNKRMLRSHQGGNCGLHVHVGKRGLTRSQIYRIQAFLNDPRNETLIKKVARRYNVGFATPHYPLAKLSPVGKDSGNRYEMLNVTNRETVEFRIFRGSLRYESVMAALEFCNALIEFCAPGNASLDRFNATAFKQFILLPHNRRDTHFLRNYLGISPVRETTDDQEQRVTPVQAGAAQSTEQTDANMFWPYPPRFNPQTNRVEA